MDTKKKRNLGFAPLETGTNHPSSHGGERDSKHQCRQGKGIFLSLTGFTLGEMVTTVAIIGTVTAVVLPNYLRVRMESDMEMVRQHVRIIGEKEIEIMGKDGKFTSEEEWKGWVENNPIDEVDEDELTITASLSAIDAKCYTTDEYFTDRGQSTFIFCTRPKRGATCSRYAGYKRFCVHYNPQMSTLLATGVAGEIDMFEGRGMFSIDGLPAMAPDDFGRFLGCMSGGCTMEGPTAEPRPGYEAMQTIDPQFLVEGFAAMLKERADGIGYFYASDQLSDHRICTADGRCYSVVYDGDNAASSYLVFENSSQNRQAFETLIDTLFSQLVSEGYEVFINRETTDQSRSDYLDWQNNYNASYCDSITCNGTEPGIMHLGTNSSGTLWLDEVSNGTHDAYQISIRSTHPPQTYDEWQQTVSTNLEAATIVPPWIYYD